MALISNGTTIFDAGAMASGFGGAMTLIRKISASSSGTVDFVHGSYGTILDSTYKEYMFTFKNIHPGTDQKAFQVNFSTDGGSNYNVTKTTTHFRAQHLENASSQVYEYVTGDDLAQSTSAQHVSNLCGNDNDQCVSGYMFLYDPANTTFVKHFMSVVNSTFTESEASANLHTAGYCNTTSAVNGVRFLFNSGNIDSGDICLYGIS
tara:strand:- start:700 stop:1317 length:618 start_codon:yes stop_codon:yes gene_type:complete